MAMSLMHVFLGVWTLGVSYVNCIDVTSDGYYSYLDSSHGEIVEAYETKFPGTPTHSSPWSYPCGGDTLAELSEDNTTCRCKDDAVVMVDPSIALVHSQMQVEITDFIRGVGTSKPEAIYSRAHADAEPDHEYHVDSIGDKICQPNIPLPKAAAGEPILGFKFVKRVFEREWKQVVEWTREHWQQHINATFNLIKSRCQHCGSRKSYIYLTNQPVAGLTDRMVVLQKTANMASTMCAKIVVPQPCVMLARMHNLGKSGKRHLSPCGHKWNKYFKLSFEIDGSDVVAGTTINSHRILEENKGVIDLEGRVIVGEDVGYPTFLGQFQRVVSAFASGNPFLWKLNIDYYRWGGLFGDARAFGGVKAGEDFPYQCDGTRVETSELALTLRDNMLKHVGLDHNAKFITLHVRMGDTKRICKYSSEKIVDITTCVMKKSNPLADSPTSPLIFFTDEKNTTWVSELQENLATALGRPVHWGDAAIRGSSTAAVNLTYDNHLVFAASRAVQTTSTAHLEMLGGSNSQSRCASCNRPSRGTRGFD